MGRRCACPTLQLQLHTLSHHAPAEPGAPGVHPPSRNPVGWDQERSDAGPPPQADITIGGPALRLSHPATALAFAPRAGGAGAPGVHPRDPWSNSPPATGGNCRSRGALLRSGYRRLSLGERTSFRGAKSDFQHASSPRCRRRSAAEFNDISSLIAARRLIKRYSFGKRHHRLTDHTRRTRQ